MVPSPESSDRSGRAGDLGPSGDLGLSRIGLGLYPFGGGYGAVDNAQAVQMLDAALEHGWSFLDTAEAYGESEALLGGLLRGRRGRSSDDDPPSTPTQLSIT